MTERDNLYSVKKAAGFLGISESTLRKYDTLLNPFRTAKGRHRRYTLAMVDRLRELLYGIKVLADAK